MDDTARSVVEPDGEAVSPTQNAVSGDAGAVVQAATISGGVHFHGVSPAPRPVGRRIAEWDPFDLDVHRAIAVPTSVGTLPRLPRYVRREHDDLVAGLLGDVADSVMVVLTGESSTGKTRALYEAVTGHKVLRDWPLVYPRTSDELLRMASADRGTGEMVLWLNETHNYLGGTNGEAVAAWLRTQLDGSRPGRIVVLGTLWPQYWAELIAHPAPGHHDGNAHVRALLQHVVRRVRVADRFSQEQVAALGADRSVDPRMAIAAATSGAGRRVIQTLAGGPALVERYEHPDHPDDRYAAAIVTAAIDARRLGYESPLTTDLLREAAAGYLGDEDRIDPLTDWCERGLTRATKNSLHGITALTPVRTQPGVGPADGYNLHDYLEQHGRTTRRNAVASSAMWRALVNHAENLADQGRLAFAAYQRLHYRYADQLYRRCSRSADRLTRLKFVDILVGYGRAAEALRLIADTGDLDFSEFTDVGRSLIRLIDHGRSDDVLAMFDGYSRSWKGASAVVQRLTAELVDLGRIDEALGLLRKVVEQHDDRELEGPWYLMGDQQAAQELLADLLAQQQRTDELQLRANNGAPYAARRLADLLADQGQWEAALQQLRSGASWGRTWLAQRLAATGQLNALRRLRDFDDDIETREILIEALLAHDHVDEALELLLTLRDKRAQRPVTDTLIDLLIKHGRVDEAVEMMLQPPWRHKDSATWSNFVDSMAARGREGQIVPLLRRLVVSNHPVAFSARQTLQQLLADQLVARNRWPEVLELLKRADGWPNSWLPRQLSRLGHVNHLRRLAEGDNHAARVELVDLLLAKGHAEEALTVLQTWEITRPRARWASRRLAEILVERGDHAELRTRVVTGNEQAARVLVEHAYRGKLPDAEQLLATGLEPEVGLPGGGE